MEWGGGGVAGRIGGSGGGDAGVCRLAPPGSPAGICLQHPAQMGHRQEDGRGGGGGAEWGGGAEVGKGDMAGVKGGGWGAEGVGRRRKCRGGHPRSICLSCRSV